MQGAANVIDAFSSTVAVGPYVCMHWVHTHTHKTATKDDDATTLHHTCVLKFFYLLMLGFG